MKVLFLNIKTIRIYKILNMLLYLLFIVEDCKKRWKNIRDSYNRNKRKLSKGSERSMKKKWSLVHHVSFLDTVEHERR